MLVKKDNSINIAHILPNPSQWKIINSFLRQRLHIYNLDVPSFKKCPFFYHRDVLFPQTQAFACLVFSSTIVSLKYKNRSHIPHPSTSKKHQLMMQMLSSVCTQQNPMLALFAQRYLPFHSPLRYYNGKLQTLNEYPRLATSSGKGML